MSYELQQRFAIIEEKRSEIFAGNLICFLLNLIGLKFEKLLQYAPPGQSVITAINKALSTTLREIEVSTLCR